MYEVSVFRGPFLGLYWSRAPERACGLLSLKSVVSLLGRIAVIEAELAIYMFLDFM